MRRLTLFGLALVFGLLALVWLRQQRSLATGELYVHDRALFEGFDAEAVVALRVDNRERAVQVKLERDARGAWYLTDPIAYPAWPDLVRSLLDTLARARGEVLAERVPLAPLGLDPPRVVLEVTQASALGPRLLRCEVGTVDVDPRLVHVRVSEPTSDAGARVMRAPRTISTTLDRNPDDYRETHVCSLDAGRVRRVRRTGGLAGPDGERVDPALEARLEDGRWRLAGGGPRVRLDPAALGLVVRCVTELRAKRFVEDAPESLAAYGLDESALRIELEDDAGRSEALRFASPPAAGGRWLALREGLATVFEVLPSDVALLRRPREAFYDLVLVRALREQVVALELQRDGALLSLQRDRDGWSVAPRATGERPAPAARFPADEARVSDLLASIERAQLGGFLPGMAFEPAPDGELALAVVTADGTRFGGRVGAVWRDVQHGAAGRLFLREGDDVTSFVAQELAELCRTPLEELRRSLIHALPEAQVARVELARGETRLVYARAETQWYPLGVNLPAPPAFTTMLDGLLNLRAEAWLEADDQAPLAERVDVLLRGSFGEPRRFALARDGAGRVLAILPDGQRACVSPQLLENALSLFGS